MTRAEDEVSGQPQQLPTGTATFLFTDIEGSTSLLQRLGEQFTGVLEAHNRLLRSAILANGGIVPRTEGDAFFAVFPSTPRAVAAAAQAQRALADQRWPDGVTLRVRMGLHTGEATPGGDEYVGLDVHRAARIASVAHGGQVLLSEATRGLVAHALPVGVALRDLGAHRLKDLAHAERLYQLVVDGLPSEFPPLRTLDALPNNLPLQLTSFIGRDTEVAEGRRLLGTARLLTLTGPGGTGKTRLSLQIAAEAAGHFPDGAFFVPLAPITDPELVASTIAQTLGLRDTGTRPPREQLLEYVRDKRLLLVLDNFEQILAAAPLVGDLLRASPGLKVLVTSRAVLHVSGEQEFPVPPLRSPDPKALPADPEALSQYEAVKLFIERAVAVKPDFQVTNANAPAVAAICVRLDGLPLAIELAAARVKLLPPQAILARLEHRLALLESGARDLPARQRTLRGAIAWSEDLLDEPARRLFATFGVFTGGVALEQVEAVCGPAEDLGCDVLEGTGALVDQSLVRQEEADGEPRFWMLETIREYALERLAESGEAEAIRDRHARAFLAVAKRAAPELTGADQKAWLDRLEREHDNLRAALDWCVAAGRAEIAMRLVAALWRFWHMRGHLHEARERVARVLALPACADYREARVEALEAAGGLAYWQGDLPAARPYYQQALELSREMGDEAATANALYNLSFTFSVHRDDLPRARALVEEALAIYRRLGDRAGIAKTLWGLGTSYYFQEEYAAGRQLFEESLVVFRELGDRFGLGWALHMVGAAAVKLGDLAAARDVLADALAMFADVRDVSGVVLVLDDLSELATAAGEPERAIRLAGAASALEASSGVELASVVNKMIRQGRPGDDLRDEAVAAAWAEGRAMSLEQAVEYALTSVIEAPARISTGA